MEFIILTNNPYVESQYGQSEQLKDRGEVRYMDSSLTDIMLKVRDYIHQGHKLLSHPLSGSVRPHETPYKSVMISAKCGNSTDEESLDIIEASIACCKKLEFLERQYPEQVNQKRMSVIDADFQYIDFTLIDTAVDR